MERTTPISLPDRILALRELAVDHFLEEDWQTLGRLSPQEADCSASLGMTKTEGGRVQRFSLGGSISGPKAFVLHCPISISGAKARVVSIVV